MQRFFHRPQRCGRADVEPLAGVAQAPEAPRLLRLVVETVEGEGACRRAGEEPRVQDLDAGVDEGGDLALLAAAQAADRIHHVVADALIAEGAAGRVQQQRSEEHTSELQSLMRISYAVFCLKKKTTKNTHTNTTNTR